MNILYVSPFSHIGGGEVSILTVIANLKRDIFQPLLVCYEDGPFVDKAKRSGIETIVFRRTGLISEFSIIWKLVRYIKKKKICLMHVNSLDIRAGIAAWLAGIPFIGHLRVIFPFTWRDWLFVRLSIFTIAVSEAAADEFCKYSEVYRNKFIVIPNVADIPEAVRAAPLRSEFNIPESAVLIGMAGRMDPFKGHTIFIDAAPLIRKGAPQAWFFIIGGTSPGVGDEVEYLEMLKRRIRGLGLTESFIFTGFRDDILSTIAALDVMVVPSCVIRKGARIVTEGFGRVAIEAMAVGVPVVASDAGGLKEIIEPGVSGLLVPTGNSTLIAEAVIGLLRDRKKADAMRSAAKSRFEALYSPRSLDRLYNVYDDIIGRGRRRYG